MHDEDRDAWLAIERGERQPRWSDLFGAPAGAGYLTQAGKAVAQRAAHYLERFFGAPWLGKALGTAGPGGVRVPTLARFAPVMSPYNPADAFLELTRWWAAFETLESVDAPGLARVRRDAKSDIRTDRLLHTLTQTRLAAIGASRGGQISVEPIATRQIGDVLLRFGTIEVLFEVVTIGVDADFQQLTAASDEQLAYLRGLEREHHVHWQGDLPGHLDRHELGRWQQTMRVAAQTASVQARAVSTEFRAGEKLIAAPGHAPEGTVLSGPTTEADQGHRLLLKLRSKAEQTQRGGAVWIWVEDHGLFQPFTAFQRMPLPARVDAFAELIMGLLADQPHIAGVVLSNASRRVSPMPNQTVHTPRGYGFGRSLPGDRYRESIVVPRRLVLPDQTRLVASLCEQEPQWLSWSLRHLGVPGGAEALLQR